MVMRNAVFWTGIGCRLRSVAADSNSAWKSKLLAFIRCVAVIQCPALTRFRVLPSSCNKICKRPTSKSGLGFSFFFSSSSFFF